MKRYGLDFTLTKAEYKAIKLDERAYVNAFNRDNQNGFTFHVEYEPINDTHITMTAYVFTYEMTEAEAQAEIEKRFNKKANFTF